MDVYIRLTEKCQSLSLSQTPNAPAAEKTRRSQVNHEIHTKNPEPLCFGSHKSMSFLQKKKTNRRSVRTHRCGAKTLSWLSWRWGWDRWWEHTRDTLIRFFCWTHSEGKDVIESHRELMWLVSDYFRTECGYFFDNLHKVCMSCCCALFIMFG